MSLRPEALDHLRRFLSAEIEDAVQKDHQEMVAFIDKKIDKLKDKAGDIDRSWGDSGTQKAIINALNEIRVKLF